jgi:very-short-patch-repair endonuclease
MAAVLAGGDGAMLSYRSAGELWNLLAPIEGPVHVTVPHGGRNLPGVRFHRSRNAGEHTLIQGIPVTTAARTLLDLAGVVSPTQLRHAYHEASGRGDLDRAELTRLCERSNGHRGLGVLRALLDEEAIPLAEARSDLEQRFLWWCRDRGLPTPTVNVPVAGYEVDCLWPEHGVVVELDSWTHHANRDAFEADRKRDAAIQLTGHRILRVTHRRITREGDQLEAEIRHLFNG